MLFLLCYLLLFSLFFLGFLGFVICSLSLSLSPPLVILPVIFGFSWAKEGAVRGGGGGGGGGGGY